MRKKSFLRAIAIVVCLAFITLSVPAISTAKDSPDKAYFQKIMKQIRVIVSLLPFIHIDNSNAPAPEKISKNIDTDTSSKVKKVTGTVNSIKKPDQD